MASVSAQDITKTYYCKAPGCENESRSPVGKYAYCPEHMGTAALRVAAIDGKATGAEKALRDLLSLAKQVDRAKARAEKAQRAANEANRKADDLEDAYKDALAVAARGGSLA